MSVKICIAANDVQEKTDRYEIIASRFGEGERKRLEKIKNEQKRRQSACALEALGELLSTSEKVTVIKRNEKGKPYFESSDLSFSLSHSALLSAAVCSDSACVGIDIERADKNLFLVDSEKYKKISARFFGGKEMAELENAERSKKELMFYRIWTKKEAYAKLCGDGLTALLGSDTDKSDLTYRFYELEYSGELYYLGVCTEIKNEKNVSIKLADGIELTYEE